MSIQLRLAVRYLAGRKLRTALTTLAIVLGVMVIFGLNGILPGMMQSIQQVMLASVGQVDLSITSASSGTFEPSVAHTVARIEGVRAVSPALRRTIAVPRDSGLDASALVIVGIDPVTAPHVRPYPLAAGRMLRPSDESGTRTAAMMSRELADKLGLRLGERFKLPSASGTTEFELVGTLDTPALPGSEEVIVSLPMAQRMFDVGDRISEIDAGFVSGADREAVQRAVRRAIGPDYIVGAVQTESPLSAGFQAASFIMNTIGVFALAMGGFIILNTFRTIVSERRHDIGMLRAVGASRQAVLGMFLLESLMQGLLGTGLGLLAGYGLAIVANNALGRMVEQIINLPPTDVQFTPATWATSILLGVGVTVLAALVPARAAARITPLEALRPAIGDVYEAAATKRGWAGLALIVIAVVGLLSGNTGLAGLSAVLLLAGLALGSSVAVKPLSDFFSRAIELVYRSEGGVARANLQRNPGRAAATASAVMISIALIVALVGTITSTIEGFGVYAEKSTGTDYLILPQNLLLGGGTVGAGPELRARVQDTPGIGDVATLRFANTVLNDTAVQVVGIDPKEYGRIAGFEYSKGSSEADLALLERDGTVLANGVFTAQFGSGRGDTLRMPTPSGERRFRVVGVGNDYMNAKIPTLYVSQAALERWWGVTTDVLILADARPDADKAAVLRELTKTVAEFPSFALYDTAAWRKVQADLYAQMESIYYVLALILAVPSLLALLNTLTIGVLARTREIGMLRAVGGTRKQIKRIVLSESLLLAALGLSAGLIAGVWLGYVMILAVEGLGLTMPYRFPGVGIALAVAVGLSFAALAALIPARQAAKLDVIRALRYE